MADINKFELNAKLQKKKNKVRGELAEMGVLKREGENKFDRYSYFSEAQYKTLFTKLFYKNGLELKFDEVNYQTFEGTEKQANGRMATIKFSLIDIDTGYSEETTITGEGIDKGDKAGYKAYTGALKYFLANTFMVATGDDAEKESPSHNMNAVKRKETESSPQDNRTQESEGHMTGKIPQATAKRLWSFIQEANEIEDGFWVKIKTKYNLTNAGDVLKTDYNEIVKMTNKVLAKGEK